ncbi:hypothetical protein D1AOALGA4SA_11727 [Olavius algarvensis Delta 1 endosymbiont]|nr:hypothetical protein D1AOALGA4SA_11727 [Olavius algarvensis Delta 1 endosymbiont]
MAKLSRRMKVSVMAMLSDIHSAPLHGLKIQYRSAHRHQEFFLFGFRFVELLFRMITS